MPEKKILTPFQENILKIFSSIEESKAFYLTGGTALAAFYLGHRLSEDLDIFTPEEPLIPIMARKFKEALRNAGYAVEETRNFKSFWEAVISLKDESVKVQFAYDTPFLLDKLQEKSGIKVHSLADIAVGKLLALYGRAEERDFIDVYFVIQENLLSLEQMLALARQKDPGLDEYYLAIAFEQSESLPDDPSRLKVSLLTPVDPKQLKSFFRSKAVELLEKWKK